jgi:hypothetical protein
MRKLDTKSRALIIRLLVEGNSIRATSRIADVSKTLRLNMFKLMKYGHSVTPRRAM